MPRDRQGRIPGSRSTRVLSGVRVLLHIRRVPALQGHRRGAVSAEAILHARWYVVIEGKPVARRIHVPAATAENDVVCFEGTMYVERKAILRAQGPSTLHLGRMGLA